MTNRKQPFGYKIASGEIIVHPTEAELVREIFQQYIAGKSLGRLTETLRQQDIPYDEGRSWNKNIVSRILEDERYIGKGAYPKLIEAEQLLSAAEQWAKKSHPPQKTEAQKVLRRLCRMSVSKQVEQSVINLLNSLVDEPEQIQIPDCQSTTAHFKTAADLTSALEQQPVDENLIRTLIFQTAAEQYNALGNQVYETERLRRLFTASEHLSEINADLLKSTVSEVIIIEQTVKLRLKNGQIIEKRNVS